MNGMNGNNMATNRRPENITTMSELSVFMYDRFGVKA